MIINKLGSQIASDIVFHGQSTDHYPLLLCLAFDNDHYTTLHVYNNHGSDRDVMYDHLSCTRADFDSINYRSSGSIASRTKRWYSPPSSLASLAPGSPDFRNIAKKVNLEKAKTCRIQKVENLIWAIQYDMEKRKGRHESEREIYFACPVDVAEGILHRGFDTYNPEKCQFHDSFRDKDRSTDEEKAVLIFQKSIQTNDSTTYRNEEILPQYCIIYKK